MLAPCGSTSSGSGEGFARFLPGSIVQFFDYALGSLEAVEDYLHESRLRKFIDESRFATIRDLAEHTRATTLKFKRFHEAKLPPKRPIRTSSRRTIRKP